MSREEIENLRVFMALDHERRLRILAFLADNGESTFDTMDKYFDMGVLYLNHHLKVLIHANLVDISWRGNSVASLYKLSKKAVEMMEEYSER